MLNMCSICAIFVLYFFVFDSKMEFSRVPTMPINLPGSIFLLVILFFFQLSPGTYLLHLALESRVDLGQRHTAIYRPISAYRCERAGRVITVSGRNGPSDSNLCVLERAAAGQCRQRSNQTAFSQLQAARSMGLFSFPDLCGADGMHNSVSYNWVVYIKPGSHSLAHFEALRYFLRKLCE